MQILYVESRISSLKLAFWYIGMCSALQLFSLCLNGKGNCDVAFLTEKQYKSANIAEFQFGNMNITSIILESVL